MVHATDPYYHLTYDHITPVARRLRFIGDKGSDKKAYPSNYPAGVQVVTSKWPVNTNSSAGEYFLGKNGACMNRSGVKGAKMQMFLFWGALFGPRGWPIRTDWRPKRFHTVCLVGHIHIMCYGSGPLKDL